MTFKTILGIDQTGAVDRYGKPRPLFASLLRLHDMSLTNNLRLPGLSETEVMNLAGQDSLPVLILVDAALGLPESLNVPFSEVMKLAAGFNSRGREFGSGTAHDFFSGFLSETQRTTGSYPARQAEAICKANTVFRLRPYQRNIGCGSFRILKELGSSPGWFKVWPFDAIDAIQVMIAESYPSLMWKLVLGSPKRSPEVLLKALRREYPGTNPPASADDADACILALGAKLLLEEGYFTGERTAIMQQEGWIAGLTTTGTT